MAADMMLAVAAVTSSGLAPVKSRPQEFPGARLKVRNKHVEA